MKIRQATKNDLDQVVSIDKNAYGDYGGDKKYFAKKLADFSKGFFVIEEKGKVTGFIIFQIMKPGDTPVGFSGMSFTKPFKNIWMYTDVFTTKTNYKDKKLDAELLLFAEKFAKDLGCTEAGVPLTKDHPFKENGVFEFWEMNDYKKSGEINWIPAPHESFACYFYRKQL